MSEKSVGCPIDHGMIHKGSPEGSFLATMCPLPSSLYKRPTDSFSDLPLKECMWRMTAKVEGGI